jgi:hypothetical protein
MYEVKKNVPRPKVTRPQRAARRKYPFEKLEVGDMFFVPNKSKNTLATHVSTTGKSLGRKFATQLITMTRTRDGSWELCDATHPSAVTGIGVWRTE